MIQTNPFNADRNIGHVYRVEGSFADVLLFAANKFPRSYHGEYLARGEVGEFVTIDVGGLGVFGRILRVGTPPGRAQELSGNPDHQVHVECRIHLLSSFDLGGDCVRGIKKYPKVGDPVFAASLEVVRLLIGFGSDTSQQAPQIGSLTMDDSIAIEVPFPKLFGKHLAIVGATGSGKSWTLSRIIEVVYNHKGKLLLIDATGEFSSLDTKAKHLAFGSLHEEPNKTNLAGIPHYMMRESDRNAFLNPSSGVQLPKLREAVRSLRLAQAITSDPRPSPDHKRLITHGLLRKENNPIAIFQNACKKYSTEIEKPDAPFEFTLLPQQLEYECIWPTNKNSPSVFGGTDQGAFGYVSPLVSRINDLIQTPEIMDIIDPSHNKGTGDALEEIEQWLSNGNSHILRISLRNLAYSNHLREIVVNIIGRKLMDLAREGKFQDEPLVVAVDEAHQFFSVTVGNEFATTHLNSFESIAKEGRKYGLTVCLATQRPGDLPAGVISQVGMTIVHRLADGRDRERVEKAAAELDLSALRLLPGLVPGEAILMGIDFPVPMSVRIQKPSSPPSSDGPSYARWQIP